MKTCKHCSKSLDESQFAKRSASPDGLQPKCKSCTKEYYSTYYQKNKDTIADKRKPYDRLYRQNNKDTIKNKNLKATYGITLDDYKEMLDSQDHTCDICNQVCSSGKPLVVDHCHTTGKVRGLLCMHCNTGLGHFNDSEQHLNAAIAYLKKS